MTASIEPACGGRGAAVITPPLVRDDRSLAITIGDRSGRVGGFLNCRDDCT
jgi:hypothetical protein